MKNREWFVERLYICIYQEAIERKEKRARRFHFCGEESSSQRTVLLDKDMMKKGRNPTVFFFLFFLTGCSLTAHVFVTIISWFAFLRC